MDLVDLIQSLNDIVNQIGNVNVQILDDGVEKDFTISQSGDSLLFEGVDEEDNDLEDV